MPITALHPDKWIQLRGPCMCLSDGCLYWLPILSEYSDWYVWKLDPADIGFSRYLLLVLTVHLSEHLNPNGGSIIVIQLCCTGHAVNWIADTQYFKHIPLTEAAFFGFHSDGATFPTNAALLQCPGVFQNLQDSVSQCTQVKVCLNYPWCICSHMNVLCIYICCWQSLKWQSIIILWHKQPVWHICCCGPVTPMCIQ